MANAARGEVAENRESLPPTGRDGLLYQYSVTITPTYANNNPVVVKVNSWQNTDASPLSYTPPTLESSYTEGTDKLTMQVIGGMAEAVTAAQTAAQAQGGFFFIFGAPHLANGLEREQIQAQIDLLIATGDRSPEAMRTLAYLQQLLATARPEKTQLLANYPNPFNPETWIPYELATDTRRQDNDLQRPRRGRPDVAVRTAIRWLLHRSRACGVLGRSERYSANRSPAVSISTSLKPTTMSALRKMVILK